MPQEDPDESATVLARALVALRWAGGAWIVGKVITLGIGLVVIRILAPKDFGLMALAFVFVELVTLSSNLGLPVVLVQKASLSKDMIRKTYGAVVASRVFFFCGLQLIAPLIGRHYGQDLVPVIRVLSLTMLISAVSEVPESLLRRDLDFGTVSRVELFSIVCHNATTLSLAFGGHGVWALVYGHIVAAVVRAVGIIGLSRFFLLPSFRTAGLSSDLRFGIKVAAKSVISHFNSQVDAVVIGKSLGSTQLGYFEVAARLAKFPQQTVFMPLSRVGLAAFSRLGRDTERVKLYFLRSLENILLVFFPVCWGLSVTAQDLVQLVFGQKWEDAIPVLQIIALVEPVTASLRILTPVLDAQGHPGVSLLNQLTLAACLIPAIWIGTAWGLSGAGIGLVAGSLIAAGVNLGRSLPVLGVSARDFMRIFGPLAAATGVMYLAVWLCQAYLLDEQAAPWRLAASIAVGAIVYGGIVFAYNRQALVRVARIFRS